MKKVFLIRHGETDWDSNKDLKYFVEVYDCGLNKNGLQQVKQSIDILKEKGIQHIYSSHLRVAYETSKILSEELNVGYDIKENLEEFLFHDDSIIGLTKQEIKEKLDTEKLKICMEEKDSLMHWRPLNCKTKIEARNTIFDTVSDICEKSPFDVILIVSHGIILRELLRALNFENDLKIKHCEIIEAEYNDQLKIINRVVNEN